ncbi:DUF1330 domain-containing protein [Halioxenophilus sp. WMMB6]|uniref:DUF1330 domain-containing protein n=1 Tax=Halioxenophilus sp. WMMB6 TaxID=3073815 RepID=UPI00295F1346|nr:DUF1330 domain-containing protein [Halioxenophilus sp. WMMB6]
MPAYIVVTREGPIIDQQEMDTYQTLTRSKRPNVPVEPIVIYGQIEGLEGTVPEAVIMLKFESMDVARDWYFSPEYQEAVVHRQNAGKFNAFLVNGL